MSNRIFNRTNIKDMEVKIANEVVYDITER